MRMVRGSGKWSYNEFLKELNIHNVNKKNIIRKYLDSQGSGV